MSLFTNKIYLKMTTSFSTSPILHQESGGGLQLRMGSHGTNMDLSVIDSTLYMP